MLNIARAAAHAATVTGFFAAIAVASPAAAIEVNHVPSWSRSVGFGGAHTDYARPLAAPAAERPAAAPRSLRELVEEYASGHIDDEQLECLAGAVYFESKGEPLEGQLAVAEVIINRANSGRYPASWCGVVTQKSQFSFVRGGRIPAIPRGSPAWAKAVAIAQIAANDLADSAADEAMFFHANYVRPSWRGLKRITRVGNHIFYR